MDYPLEHTIDEPQEIHVRRIKAGSLFKLVAIGVFSVMVPLFIFFGVLALFGFRTVYVNQQQLYGFAGLFAAIVMAPIFSLIFSVLGWVALYIGIRVFGHFKPITISYVSDYKPKA
jgi:hypothetical protein